MADTLDRLNSSPDPLDNHLARVLEHWQDQKRSLGQRASLGYEPRDLIATDSVTLISSRVLSAASGFEEVDPELSYEAIVLKYRQRFTDEVIRAAKERLRVGKSKAEEFIRQDVQFFIKSSFFELFGNKEVRLSRESWLGELVSIPKFLGEKEYAESFFRKGSKAFLWLHEQPSDGPGGKGLTGIVQFGELNTDRTALIEDILLLERPVGKDLFEAHKGNENFISMIGGSRHTRIWPVADNDVELLLNAVQTKIRQIDAFQPENPDPSDPDNLEQVDNETSLRQVTLRRYQAAFRKALLAERGAKCAISGIEEVEVLEAAHIIPYAARFADRDKTENGLLLRRDIHTLFDLHLISIDPVTMQVVTSPQLTASEYRNLSGIEIVDKIGLKNITNHYQRFQLRNF